MYSISRRFATEVNSPWKGSTKAKTFPCIPRPRPKSPTLPYPNQHLAVHVQGNKGFVTDFVRAGR